MLHPSQRHKNHAAETSHTQYTACRKHPCHRCGAPTSPPPIQDTIKYLYIQYEIYNAVDDIVSDRFGRDDMELQYTGPLKPGRSDSGIWDCIIYDCSAKRLVITGLTIEYMDGIKIQYDSEEVKALIKKQK